MISQASYVDQLRGLPSKELDQELRRKLAAGLQDLVAGIEHACAERGKPLRTCAIEDLDIVKTSYIEDRCVVLLGYRASARRHGAGPDNRNLFGSALVSIAPSGEMTYRGVTLSEEREIVPPDVGGGD